MTINVKSGIRQKWSKIRSTQTQIRPHTKSGNDLHILGVMLVVRCQGSNVSLREHDGK